MSEVDESKFPYGYVPEHLKERVKNWRSLSVGERLELTSELSSAAWAKIGVVRDPSKPMDKTIRRAERSRVSIVLDEAEVASIIRFLGFGRASANVWSVGLEEGLGDMTSDEARENIKQRAHFSEIMDLREAHLRLKEKGQTIDVEVNTPKTAVWKWMARIVLLLKGAADWNDPISIKQYVRFHLGRANGETFLTELSPIPSRNRADDCWPHWFKTRDLNLEKQLQERKAKLKQMIAEYSRSLIICYGLSRADEFAELLGVEWEYKTSKIGCAKDGARWLLPFFGTGQMSVATFGEFASLIRGSSAANTEKSSRA